MPEIQSKSKQNIKLLIILLIQFTNYLFSYFFSDRIGPRDIDALTDYMEKFTPLTIPAAEGRITFLN